MINFHYSVYNILYPPLIKKKILGCKFILWDTDISCKLQLGVRKERSNNMKPDGRTTIIYRIMFICSYIGELLSELINQFNQNDPEWAA